MFLGLKSCPEIHIKGGKYIRVDSYIDNTKIGTFPINNISVKIYYIFGFT